MLKRVMDNRDSCLRSNGCAVIVATLSMLQKAGSQRYGLFHEMVVVVTCFGVGRKPR